MGCKAGPHQNQNFPIGKIIVIIHVREVYQVLGALLSSSMPATSWKQHESLSLNVSFKKRWKSLGPTTSTAWALTGRYGWQSSDPVILCWVRWPLFCCWILGRFKRPGEGARGEQECTWWLKAAATDQQHGSISIFNNQYGHTTLLPNT